VGGWGRAGNHVWMGAEKKDVLQKSFLLQVSKMVFAFVA